MNDKELTIAQVADILGVSKETLRRWETSGKLVPDRGDKNNYRLYSPSQLDIFDEAKSLTSSNWNDELEVKPTSDFSVIELFAGAGGLALGMEKAGLNTLLLSELDKHACNTLLANRPNWNVVQGDVAEVDFTPFRGQVDVLSGGFPCQAFSYAGKKRGFEDARGTLFYEFARAVKETSPRVIVAENVRGLLNHDEGKTLSTIKEIIDELGYELVEPRVLKAIFYQVPQKRERLFLVAIRKDLAQLASFGWPSPYKRIMTMKDALKAGSLFDTDVPKSEGQKYPESKAEVLKLVPPGGYWRDLPLQIQKDYMKKSFYLGGGKTGMARRLSWDEPSLTLTCAPAQKQTERCHPDETRPLTVREYARIQTFPDDWLFSGPITAQYKQIGNAVPVNLSYAVARSVVRLLNKIEEASRAEKQSRFEKEVTA
jgi:DNA (cytosine-5)-methyltransferase 1